MRDCPDVTMRERLPDLLNYRLSAAERAEVNAHLRACADCRAELQLLERVRAASPARTVDARRIVAALPSYRTVSAWRRTLGSPFVQIAAALVLVAGGAWLLVGRGSLLDAPQLTPPVALAPVPGTVVVEPDTLRPTPQRRRPSPEPSTTELAVGEMFHDLSDAELRSLLEAMGSLDTRTPVETEVVVPAVNRGGP